MMFRRLGVLNLRHSTTTGRDDSDDHNNNNNAMDPDILINNTRKNSIVTTTSLLSSQNVSVEESRGTLMSYHHPPSHSRRYGSCFPSHLKIRCYIFVLVLLVILTTDFYYKHLVDLWYIQNVVRDQYDHILGYDSLLLLVDHHDDLNPNSQQQTGHRSLPTTDTNQLPLYFIQQQGHQEEEDTLSETRGQQGNTRSFTNNSLEQNLPDLGSLEVDHYWYPRIVHLDRDELEFSSTILPKSGSRIVDRIGNETCTYCEEEYDSYVWPMERPFMKECKPMHNWQTQQFSTCNVFHEIDLQYNDDEADVASNHQVSLLSMEGSWRSVWKLTEELSANIVDPSNATNLTFATMNKSYVLKLLQYPNREFNHESYNYHRIDALAMERLTSSPYIVSMYGYCGQSVITEIASKVSAREYIKDPLLTPLERLEMGRNMARALSHVHTIDCHHMGDNLTSNQSKCYPSLAHNDINMANVLNVDGTINLNDFNIGIFLRWNNTSDQPCGDMGDGIGRAPVRFESLMWKSPEEVLNVSYVDPSQSDVYGLGNLLFQILTKRQPWTHLEPNGKYNSTQVGELKLIGSLPYITPKYSTEISTDQLALLPLYYAVLACFRYEPTLRPTSTELANKLNHAYQYYYYKEHKRIPPQESYERHRDDMAEITNKLNPPLKIRSSEKSEIKFMKKLFEPDLKFPIEKERI